MNIKNKPCWCGSGKKYKYCHLLKESKNKTQPYEIHKDFQKSLKYKTCKVPFQLKNQCSRTMTNAHTISKGMNLKYIANEKNEVYGLDINLHNIDKNNKLANLKLMHINKASAYYIFCQYHDNELFKVLDDSEFVFTEEQVFLLHYRIISKVIYLKEQQTKLFQEKVGNYDNGKNMLEQKSIKLTSHMFSDSYSQLNDIQKIKNILDKNLLVKNFNDIKYYSLIIDRIPEVMSAGAFIPDMDFDGNILIDYIDNYTDEYNAISTSIFKYQENKGIIIFCWNDKVQSNECEIFIKNLNCLPNEEKIQAIGSLLFKLNKESVYISPKWYDSLSMIKKDLIESCYIPSENINLDDSAIDEIKNSDISLFPKFMNDIDNEILKNILNSYSFLNNDISNYEEFNLFDWNIIEIKTNLLFQ